MGHELIDSTPFIEGRGDSFCRGCLGMNLFSGLNLGELPIANELLTARDVSFDKYPLHLRICSECCLGQVADVVTPERIFRDYRYFSSISSTFLQHASDFVNQRLKEEMFSPGDWVLEIASNDGYLLKNFLPSGIKTIGVEPAENVAEVSKSLGINTISEFFSSSLAIELLEKHGHPKLIIANNVMAHVPDLIDFVKGLAILCGADTQISIENPSLSNILIGMQFDTIYHEHYSYLSASAVSKIGKSRGLLLFKVEELSIHGGSNRYWLRAASENAPIHPSVDSVIRKEQNARLFDGSEWKNYSLKVQRILNDFRNWLAEGAENGSRVFGYGAAAKASTILNSINFEVKFMKAIADASPEKQNRFMPPHGIEIISPQQMFAEKPTDVVIFPWNIKSEIAKYLRSNLDAGIRLWCAIPEMHQVEI